MPSSLPIELLRLILDNFACPPMSNDGTLENPHRDELLSLCLTSKIFRQIAQPLLFAIIPFDTDASDMVRKQIISLMKNMSVLPKTHTVVLIGDSEVEKDAEIEPLLVTFFCACAGVDKVVSSQWGLGFRSFSGSSLKQLYVNGANMNDCKPVFVLPFLDKLSLVDVTLPQQGFSSRNFPSLRHFAYDDSQSTLDQDASSTIESLSSQLDSLSLVYDLVSNLFSDQPLFPCDRLLVDYLCGHHSGFPQSQGQTRHIRVLLGDITSSVHSASSALEHVKVQLQDFDTCRHLRSVYLPPLANLQGIEIPPEFHQAADDLVSTCRNRQIEIVHEEQPTGIRAETQLSEEFMRRMTKERIEREASNGM